jgi:hypothetical protein
MGALPQALEIVFEGKTKKKQEENKAFQLTKCIFFLFFSSLYLSYFQIS